MLISVIIPCKNEPYIDKLINEIHSCLTYSHEILIQTEPGLAKAVVHGAKRAKGDVLVVLDGDGSHKPQNLNTMVNLVATYPVVVGSRYINGGISKDSLVRQFLSRLFCKVARCALRLEVRDTMSGFVAMDRRVLNSVHLKPIGYKFLLEILVKSNGCYKTIESPIVFEPRKMGYSKTGLRVCVSTFAFISFLWLWKITHEF
jgi:dolichol-phosphate mannosyltransferase